MARTISHGIRSSSITGEHKSWAFNARQHIEATIELEVCARKYEEFGESGLLLARRCQWQWFGTNWWTIESRYIPIGTVSLSLGMLGWQRIWAHRWRFVVFRWIAFGALEHNEIYDIRWGGKTPWWLSCVGRISQGTFEKLHRFAVHFCLQNASSLSELCIKLLPYEPF